MTLKDYQEQQIAMRNHCFDLTATKAIDYADAADVLQNFRRGAALLGVPTWYNVFLRLTDKLSRLRNVARNGPAVQEETLYDTAADTHNYIDLLYAAISEEREVTP